MEIFTFSKKTLAKTSTEFLFMPPLSCSRLRKRVTLLESLSFHASFLTFSIVLSPTFWQQIQPSSVEVRHVFQRPTLLDVSHFWHLGPSLSLSLSLSHTHTHTHTQCVPNKKRKGDASYFLGHRKVFFARVFWSCMERMRGHERLGTLFE